MTGPSQAVTIVPAPQPALTVDLVAVKKGTKTAAEMIDSLSSGLTGTGLF